MPAQPKVKEWLIALITFHWVTGLRTSWRSGGHITYRGPGNWLITVAPYFFPTICMVVLAVSLFLPNWLHTSASVILGAAIGYHVTSTYRGRMQAKAT